MPFLHLFTNLYILCISVKKKQQQQLRLVDSLDLAMLCYYKVNHKNYNFLGFDWFKKGLFSTNSLAKLLSDSLLLDSLLLDSLLSDSSKSQSHSKM